MEILNTQIKEVKKIWETPALVEITKEVILGNASVGLDAGAHT